MNKDKDKFASESLNFISDKIYEPFFTFDDFSNTEISKPSVLLHSCCGPCSTAVIERLLPEYNITVFFYNPNITDIEEYQKRKESQIKFIKKFNLQNSRGNQVEFLEGTYEPQVFYEGIKGLENELEGGQRCDVCFRIRLSETAKNAKNLKYDFFATTLTVSPHKDYNIITMIGTEISMREGVSYLDIDFKKKAGFQRSIELSKKYLLYRQNYCGCEFSKY